MLRAGSASVDISPDPETERLPLHGYGARRGKRLEGVHDPICAKVLILEQAGTHAAVVTLDILQIDAQFVGMLVAAAGLEGLDESSVFVTASHTHSAPVGIEPRSRNNVKPLRFYNERYCSRVCAAVAVAMQEAAGKLEPVRVAVGATEMPGLARNRRVPSYDYGKRTFAADERPEDLVDRELAVLHFVSEAGAPVATLVNFAAHATVLGPRNMLVSADFPGYLQRAIESRLGGVCLYANGAQGNVAPEVGKSEPGFDVAEQQGEALAGRVIELVEAAKPKQSTVLRLVSEVIELPPNSIQSDSPLFKLGLVRKAATGIVGRFWPRTTRMSGLRLDDVGLTAIPGELFTELGLSLKQRARERGVTHPLILGLANDAVGYIPPREQFGTEGGYEVSMCFYGPELGELLLDKAISQLGALFAT